MTSSNGPRTPTWMPTLRDVGEAVLTLLTTTVGLAVAVALIDGVRVRHPVGDRVLAAGSWRVGDLLLRAPLGCSAGSASAALALGVGLLAQVATRGWRSRWSPASARTTSGPSSESWC